MKFPYFKKQLSLIPYGEKLSIGATPDFALEVTDQSGLVYDMTLSQVFRVTNVEF